MMKTPAAGEGGHTLYVILVLYITESAIDTVPPVLETVIV
jgi:hypothetical protein